MLSVTETGGLAMYLTRRRIFPQSPVMIMTDASTENPVCRQVSISSRKLGLKRWCFTRRSRTFFSKSLSSTWASWLASMGRRWNVPSVSKAPSVHRQCRWTCGFTLSPKNCGRMTSPILRVDGRNGLHGRQVYAQNVPPSAHRQVPVITHKPLVAFLQTVPGGDSYCPMLGHCLTRGIDMQGTAATVGIARASSSSSGFTHDEILRMVLECQQITQEKGNERWRWRFRTFRDTPSCGSGP